MTCPYEYTKEMSDRDRVVSRVMVTPIWVKTKVLSDKMS